MVCYVNNVFLIKVVWIVVYSVFILVFFIGNIFIVILVCKYGRVCKIINLVVLNMVVVNFVIIIVYMLRLILMFLIGIVWFVEGDLGYVLCKMVFFFYYVVIIVLVLILLILGLDIFCVVVFLLKIIFIIKVVRLVIFLIWVLVIVVWLFYLMFFRIKIFKGK